VDLRELKGLELAARCQIVFRDGVWQVPSQSGNGSYRVRFSPDGASCDCEDFQLHGPLTACKHIHAARLVRERDGGGKAPRLDTDTVPKRPTYKQNWTAYNLAQTTEKHRFQVLLAELCAGIPEPPRAPKPGRKPLPIGDAVFACVFKIYSTFSSRRFATDLDEARAKGYLRRDIHYNRINAHLEDAQLTPILHDLIRQSARPLCSLETAFAPDSSGFSSSRFVKWFDEKYGVTKSGHDWVKVHLICGVKTHIVTAVTIEGREASDSPQFIPLVKATVESGFTVKEVPADKGYLSKENLDFVDGLGGVAYIPYKTNSTGGAGGLFEKMFHYYHLHREEFLKHYHQRSNVESVFSMIKAKFRDHVRSRTDVSMANEALGKILAHNLCVLIQSHCELGIEPVFWREGDAPAEEPRNILPLVRPG
jgi:transposase